MSVARASALVAAASMLLATAPVRASEPPPRKTEPAPPPAAEPAISPGIAPAQPLPSPAREPAVQVPSDPEPATKVAPDDNPINQPTPERSEYTREGGDIRGTSTPQNFGATEPEATPRPVTPRVEAPTDDESGSADGKGRGMIISGYVLGGMAGLTAATLIPAGAVLSVQAYDDFPGDRTEAEQRDDEAKRLLGTQLMLGGAVLTASFALSAVILVTVGKRARSNVAVAPTAGPQHAGLAFTGRF